MKHYANGSIVSGNETRVSANDSGFLFGLSLFETFRTYNGKPFLLDEHLQRLRRGCESFGIVLNENLLLADADRLRPKLRELLEANALIDAVFRLTLSAGPAGDRFGIFESPAELIFVRELPPPAPSGGIGLHVLRTRRTPPECFPRPKSGNFANSFLAMRELRQRISSVTDEGLLLTADGRVSEGTVSNLFFIQEKTVRTPAPTAWILEGITRNTVLDLAQKLGIELREEEFTLAELAEADAVFVTNSVRELTPVSAIYDENGTVFWRGGSAENPVFQQLSQAYSDLRNRKTG